MSGGVAIAATGAANQIDRHRVGEDDDITGNMLWAVRGNEFVTVKSLNEQGQPVGVEIFITAMISRSNPTFMRAVPPLKMTKRGSCMV